MTIPPYIYIYTVYIHPDEEIDVPSKLTLRVTAPSRRAILISAKSKRIPSELHTLTHTHSTLTHVCSVDSFIVISSVPSNVSRLPVSAKYIILLWVYMHIRFFLCRHAYI